RGRPLTAGVDETHLRLLVSLDDEVVRTERGQLTGYRGPDPDDQRGHRHHRGHADHDPEDGESRTDLVGAQGIESDGDSLANSLDRHRAVLIRVAMLRSEEHTSE